MHRTRIVSAGVAAVLAAGLVGCTDETAKQIGAMNTSNIQRVSNLYAGFQNMKSPKGPKDEAEFKEFVKAYAPNKLTAMGIDPGNPESVFTSERDGQPFKIRYKVGGGRGSVAGRGAVGGHRAHSPLADQVSRRGGWDVCERVG